MSRLFSSRSSRPSSLPTTNPAASTHSSVDRQGQTDLKPAFRGILQPGQPGPVVLPPPISLTAAKSNPAFQHITPYTHIAPSTSTPHPHVTVSQVKTAHVPSLMRITALLLPVRYQNSFFTATITDPLIASVSRVAIYHQHPPTHLYGAAYSAAKALSSSPPSLNGADKVIGGIRCRLEPATLPLPPSTSKATALRPVVNLYIQTLHLLSPYRGSGIATSLLNSLIYDEDGNSTSRTPKGTPRRPPPHRVSDMVKHYNIRTVTAHVHEANEEALAWYVARGFVVDSGVIEGYYRRLTPGGAKLVKLDLSWDDEGDTVGSGSTVIESNATANANIANEDEDWEKVEAHDVGTGEKLEDYQQIMSSSVEEVEPSRESIKRVRRG